MASMVCQTVWMGVHFGVSPIVDGQVVEVYMVLYDVVVQDIS
jgi:hypothetical protein